MSDEQSAEPQPLEHIKLVSRIKHAILAKYLPPWGRILGSTNRRLGYVDCYAGRGLFENAGEVVEGSPLVAVRAAKEMLAALPDHEVVMAFVEEDDAKRQDLDLALERVRPFGKGLVVHLIAGDSKQFVPDLLRQTPNLAPTFFFVDPYGHPLTVPILNEVLKRPRTEALINFMFYRVNMDAANPLVQHHLDTMFGHQGWRTQAFLALTGRERERGFLEYFCDQIHARYRLPFRILFDVEDHLEGKRTKYYLIHASNHPKAALLMKEVMWPLGDEKGLFEFGGRRETFLFPMSAPESELATFLMTNYGDREIAFDTLREETWDLPFIEKQYRSVIQRLKHQGKATIRPVSSKTDRGLTKQDRVLIHRPH